MKRIDLRNKLIIVTGASTGLGRALAMRLARDEQADLVLSARRADLLDRVAEEVRECGRRAWPVPVDLADSAGPSRLVSRAVTIAAERARDQGRAAGDSVNGDSRAPFGLVNNAGVTWFGRLEQMDEAALRRLVDLNISASLETTRLFVHAVLAHGEFSRARPPEPAGAILTIASLAAFLPVPYQSVYTASKHALLGFGESIAQELRGRVSVTTFAPGGIRTDMVMDTGLQDHVNGGHLASPEAVARRAVSAWKRGRTTATGGAEDAAVRTLSRILPRNWLGWGAERFFRQS